jgi:hypothetical protein
MAIVGKIGVAHHRADAHAAIGKIFDPVEAGKMRDVDEPTGNANVLLLLAAQQAYLQSVIRVVQARANRLSDTVALFQSLGGGWFNRPDPPKVRVLDVGTGQAEESPDKPEGLWRALWPFP